VYVNRRDIDCLQYFEKFDAVKNRCKLIEKGKKWNEILIDLILLTSAGQLHVLWQYCFELYSDFTLILKCVRLFWDGLLFQQHGFVIYKLVSNLRIDLKLCVNLSELFSFCNVNHGLKFCPCWTRQVKFVRQTIFHQLRATPSNCTFNFFVFVFVKKILPAQFCCFFVASVLQNIFTPLFVYGTFFMLILHYKTIWNCLCILEGTFLKMQQSTADLSQFTGAGCPTDFNFQLGSNVFLWGIMK